jgi:hypothetical protein
MVTSLTNLTGWIARLVLSAAVLCFNGPLLFMPDESTAGTPTEHVNSPHEDSGQSGFDATVTVGQGKKQVTVRLEIGRAGDRSADEAL